MAIGDVWNLLIDRFVSREKCGEEVLEKSGLKNGEQVRGTRSRVNSGAVDE